MKTATPFVQRGYAQAIALQRIFTFIFFVMITAGVPLYTPLDQLHTEASCGKDSDFFSMNLVEDSMIEL